MLKNVILVNAVLRMLFLSETYPGRVHDKRIVDERTQNAFRLKVARAEIFRVQGILRPW
jgi:hypothetical protein